MVGVVRYVLLCVTTIVVALSSIDSSYAFTSYENKAYSLNILQAPTITLLGDNEIILSQGQSFVEPGYEAFDVDGNDITSDVVVSYDFDETEPLNTPGNYVVSYNVTDAANNPAAEVTRTVIVLDTEAPVITLNDPNPLTLDQGEAFTDPGYSAIDNVDGDISASVVVNPIDFDTSEAGTFTITYNVSDAADNLAAEVTRTVIVLDTEAPVIALNEPNPFTVNQGQVFTDPGYLATDNLDGNITSNVNVFPTDFDTSEAGTFTITYNVSDAADNPAEEQVRTVIVLDTEAPVITLNEPNPFTVNQGQVFTDPGYLATDNLDGIITSNVVVNPENFDTSEAGTFTITYNVSDAADNPAIEAVRTVIVLDKEAPVITLNDPNPLTLDQGETFNDPGYSAIDNFDGDITSNVVVNPSDFDTSEAGTFTITYNVSDAANNPAAEVTRTVIVLDTEPPVITLNDPNPFTVNQGQVFTDPGYVATDNLDGNITSNVNVFPTDFDTSEAGTFTITYNVSDAANNPAEEKVRTVIVLDTEAPVITLDGDNPYIIQVGLPYVEPGVSATDNVDGIINQSEISVDSNLNVNEVGFYSIQYTATDSSGNIASETRVVQVVDTEAPVITLLGSPNITLNQGDVYTDPGYSATDNVDGDITSNVVVNPTDFDTSAPGTYLIRYNVSDSSGNAAEEKIRTVVVLDTEAPIINLSSPNPYTVNQGQVFNDPGYSAIDNFDGNITANVVVTPPNFSTSEAGTFTLRYNVSDAAGNDAVEQTRTVIVLDTEPPVIDIFGANPMSINQGESYVEQGATATDNVDGNVTPIDINGSVDGSTPGIYNIVYSATDSSGNIGTATRVVNVIDQIPPVITVLGDPSITVNQDQVFTDPGYTATDNVDGDITDNVVVTPPNFNTSQAGVFVISYNVSDAAGNEAATKTRTIEVLDTEPPVIVFLGGNPDTTPYGEPYVEPGVYATDNVDGNINQTAFSINYTTLNTNALGTYNVLYTVSDSSGNTATANRIVNVVDQTPPVISILGQNPTSIDQGDPYTDAGATAFDQIDGDLTLRIVTTPASFNTSTAGTFSIEYSVVDNAGNEATATRTVIVNDTEPPVITLLGDNPLDMGQGSGYTEPGFRVDDNVDNNLADLLTPDTSDLDNNSPGQYEVYYDISDTAGNDAIQQVRTVIVHPLPGTPTQIFGPAQTIYQGDTGLSFSVSSVTNADSYVWDFPSGATIVSGNGTNSVVVDFSTDAVSGQVTVYATNTYGAGPTSPVYNLVVEPKPKAIAGDNREICLGDETILGAASVPGSTYSWSSVPVDTSINFPTSSNPTVQPQVTTIYTLTETFSNGVSTTNSVQVLVNPVPQAEVISDTTVCENQSISIGGNGGNGNTFSWTSLPAGFSSSLANPTLSSSDLSQTRTYYLTETNPSTGCSTTNSVTITVEELPVISAGPSTDVICETENQYLLDQASSSQTSGVLFEWTVVGGSSSQFSDSNSLNPVFTPSAQDKANGSVLLQLTATPNAFCAATPVVSQITLSFEPAPIADAGPSGTICGDGSFQIAATAAHGTISWEAVGATSGFLNNYNISNPIYTPSAEDVAAGQASFRLVVSPNNPCDEAVEDFVTINITEPHSVSLPSSYVICEDDANIQLSATIQNESSIVWETSGDGVFVPANGANTSNPIYQPGPSDIANGGATLTVRVEGIGVCSAEKQAQTLITINKNPVVDAGLGGTFCEDGIELSSASATNYDTVTWTVIGGNGQFLPNNQVPNPIYVPGPLDFTNGTVTLKIEATPLASCSDTVSDVAIFEVYNNPLVNAGPDATICEGDSYTLSQATATYQTSIEWVTSGTGSFNDASFRNPIYTPSPADIDNQSVTLTMNLTAQGSCSDDQNSMVLSIVKKPVIDAGSDLTLCQGEEVQISASAQYYASIQWTKQGGSGVFLNADSLNPIYQSSPDDVGTIILTMTAQPLDANGIACGGPVSDELKLLVGETPTVEVGSDATICEGESFSFENGRVSATEYSNLTWIAVGQGDGTFSGGNSTTPTYTPGPFDRGNGSVVLRLTATPNEPCTTPAVDEMTLFITQTPEVYAGEDVSLCEDQNVLVVQDATATNYETLLWSSSGSSGTLTNLDQLEVTYAPSAQDLALGQITLTLTATGPLSCGEVIVDTKVITFVKNPVANAGADALICDTGGYVLSDAEASEASSFIWISSGDGIFIPNRQDLNPTYIPGEEDIANGGDITLTLTALSNSPCTESVSDDMILTLDPSPRVELGPNRSICEGSDLTFELIEGADVAHASSYLWSTSGDGDFTSRTVLNPTYTPGPLDKSNGEAITLTLTLGGSSTCTNTVSDSFELTIVDQLVVNAGPDISICEDGYTVSGAGQTQNFSSVLWTIAEGEGSGELRNPNSLTPTYIPSSDDVNVGQVRLVLTGEPIAPCEGTLTDDLVLSIDANPVVEAGLPITICEGETINVNGASVTGPNGGYLWSSSGNGILTGADTPTPTYIPSPEEIQAQEAVLTLTAQATGACSGEIADQLIIQINPKPEVYAGENITICEGESFTTSQAFVNDGVNPVWTTSSPDGLFSDPNSVLTTYTPTAADIVNGFVELTLTADPLAPCSGTESSVIRLSISRAPVINATNTLATICDNETYTVNGLTTDFVTTYSWDTDGDGSFSNRTIAEPEYIPGPNDKISGEAILTLTATGLTGCAPITQDIQLTIDPSPEIILQTNSISTCSSTDPVVLSGNIINNFSSVNWTSSGVGGSFVNSNDPNPEYTPSAQDLANGEVTLTVEATPTNSCTVSAFKDVTIYFVDQVVVNAGSNQTICEGSSYLVQEVSLDNYSSFTWISSGDGQFLNSNTLTPEYIPGNGDINLGSATLTLRANGLAGCSDSDEDSIILTIARKATADAGPETDTSCQDAPYALAGIATNAFSVEWLTSGDGGFTDIYDRNPNYNPGPNDILNGRVTLTFRAYSESPCTDFTEDTLILDIQSPPTVDAGPDDEVCIGESYAISNASILNTPNGTPGVLNQDYQSIKWITSGSGTFSDDSVINPTYIPTSTDYTNGSVRLTLQVTPSVACDSGSTIDAHFDLSFKDPVSGTGVINGVNDFCEGTGPYDYEITGLTGTTGYNWSVNRLSAQILADTDPNDQFVRIDFTEPGNYVLTATPFNSCGDADPVSYNVTVNPDGDLTHDPASGTLDQELCEGVAIDPIAFVIGGSTVNATIAWVDEQGDPIASDPFSFDQNGNVFTISGELGEDISSTQVYTYTVTPDSGGCVEPLPITGTITINPDGEITHLTEDPTDSTISLGALDQTLCEGEAIDDIVFSIGGGATGVVVDGLPLGVEYVFTSNVLTLYGTPSDDIDGQVRIPYSVTTTGSGCEEPTTYTGLFIINPDGDLTHDPSGGSLDQELCEGVAIDPIAFVIGGSTVNATIAWVDEQGDPIASDPFSFDQNGNVFTISGELGEDISSTQVYTYTVTPDSGGCVEPLPITGTITINPDGEITHLTEDPTDSTISLGALDQTLCEGEAIDDIVFRVSGGATGVVVDGLPLGVEYVFTSNVLTLYGTPSDDIDGQVRIPYSVTTTGSGCEEPTTYTGLFIINPDGDLTHDPASGTLDQELCEGVAIDPIAFVIGGSTVNATIAWVDEQGDPIASDPFSFDQNGNVFTISGELGEDISSTQVYTYTVTPDSGGCVEPLPITGTITINPDGEITHLTEDPTDSTISLGALDQTLCEGEAIDDIVFRVSGGATGVVVDGLPLGVEYVFTSNVLTLYGTPTDDIDGQVRIPYSVTTTGSGCEEPTTYTGLFIINPDGDLTHDPASGTLDQELCEGVAIDPIAFVIGGSTVNATIAWVDEQGDPIASDPFSFDQNGNVFTISGLSGDISSTQVYTYTVTPDSGGCADPNPITGTIVVNPDGEIAHDPSNGSMVDQILCEGEAIDPIEFTISGGATGATVTGLPAGVTGSLFGNVFTISGVPTDDISSPQLYTYTIDTTGSVGCDEGQLTGTIAVNPDGEIAHDPNSGTLNQTICEGDSIDPIEFIISGGATGATVTGLPAGVTGSLSGSVFTISGIPTDDISSPQLYTYTIDTTGSVGCDEGQLTGTIAVNPDGDIAHDPNSGTLDQTLCEGDSIDPIEFTISGGATGATVTGLPAGVTGSLSGSVFTISGVPTDDISSPQLYSYTIDTTGSVGCDEGQLTGTITINPDGDIVHDPNSGALDQTLCEGEPIEDIIITIGGGATGVSVTGLPTGVSDNYDSTTKTLTISGVPANTQPIFNYTITTTGSGLCDEPILTGSIAINPDGNITHDTTQGPTDQEVCEGSPITDIVFAVGGGATDVLVTGLPFGVTHLLSSGILTISGTPLDDISAQQVFNYTITSVSGFCPDVLTGTIVVNPDGDIAHDPNSGSLDQTVCEGAPIEDIEFTIGGGASAVNVIGLPAGVSYAVNDNVVVISGIPSSSPPQTFNYTITTTGSNTCNESSVLGVIDTKPSFSLSPSFEVQPLVCYGNEDAFIEVDLTGILTPNEFYTARWTGVGGLSLGYEKTQLNINDSDTSIIAENLQAGSYVFELWDNEAQECGYISAPILIDEVKPIFVLTEPINPDDISGNTVTLTDEYGDAFTYTSTSSNGGYVQKPSCESTSDDGIIKIQIFGNDYLNTKIEWEFATLNSNTWVSLPALDNQDLITGLAEGIYRATVTETDPQNPARLCSVQKEIPLIRDVVEVQNLCMGEPGYLSIELVDFIGTPTFTYNEEVIVPLQGPDIIDLISTYVLPITLIEDADLVISNEDNCSRTIPTMDVNNQGILNLEDSVLPDPDYIYTSVSSRRSQGLKVGEDVTFEVDDPNDRYYRLEWDFGDGSTPILTTDKQVTHIFDREQVYDVTLTVYGKEDGCLKQITKPIQIGGGYVLLVPNVFTPNGDGINDEFLPEFTGFKNISMSIFDASGSLLFESINERGSDFFSTDVPIIKPWDGANVDLTNKLFVCHIVGTLFNDEIVTKTTTIQILK